MLEITKYSLELSNAGDANIEAKQPQYSEVTEIGFSYFPELYDDMRNQLKRTTQQTNK